MTWLCLIIAGAHTHAGNPFVIHVVDAQTNRGIPLVQLSTTNGIVLHTDSNGLVAFDEPGLMNSKVYFSVSSPGYTYPKDGFGNRGKAFITRPGETASVSLKRTQIAQRLYRLTGQGIYHHSHQAKRPLPWPNANLNGRVMGQDTVMAVPHLGKIYWFWGDTARPAYPLGHFGTAMATSPPADQIDPAKGIRFDYAVDEKGFSKPVFQLGKPGVVWFHGATKLHAPSGQPRIVGHYSRLKSLGHLLEHGISAFNEQTGKMEIVKTFPIKTPLHPFGQTLHHVDDGKAYVYFCTPYPHTRVEATWEAFINPDRYEAFTPLKAGTTNIDFKTPALDRSNGQLVHGWKKKTAKVTASAQHRLIQSGAIQQNEALIQSNDENNQPMALATGSVRWNPYRKRWVMIACRQGGDVSFLGEIYYLESKHLIGPWPKAIKVATHPGYTFYNPVHHSFLDREDGRIIHFEGTYTKQFSKTKTATPRYDYNQIMYKIDLGDPRIQKTFAQP